MWPFRAPKREYLALLEPYFESVDLEASPSSVVRQLARLPSRVRVLYCAHWLFWEVENGGFVQYFWNPSGCIAPEAHAAFAELGLAETAAIISSAMSEIGNPYPRGWSKRHKVLDGVWEHAPSTDKISDALRGHTRAFYRSLGHRGLPLFVNAANALAARDDA